MNDAIKGKGLGVVEVPFNEKGGSDANAISQGKKGKKTKFLDVFQCHQGSMMPSPITYKKKENRKALYLRQMQETRRQGRQ